MNCEHPFQQTLFKSSSIPAEWRIVRLRDLGEVNRGRSRHRPRYAEHLYGGLYPFIQTGDIKSSKGKIKEYTQTYSEAGLAQSRLWPAGTMCITIAANIAETSILTFPACFPDSVIGFIADNSKCDINFVEYTLRYLKSQIQREAIGSVQDNINLETFERIHFALPPLPEQFAISKTLGNFDSKIEINQEMNRALEGIGQIVFKRWFVDFEFPNEEGKPYKSSGGEMVNSTIGEIPKGWEIGGLSDICDITMGQSPPGDTYNETGEGIPFFQGIRDFGFRFPSRRIYCTAPTRLAQAEDVLLSVRAPVGSLNVAEERCVIGRGVAALHLKGKQKGFLYYLLLATRSGWGMYESGGTVFGSATKQDVHDFKIVIPTKNLRDQFGELIEPLDKRILINELESRNLTMIRDSLLPRLMSGKIRVPINNKMERQ